MHIQVTEFNAVLDEDTRQEWVFTLYDFDTSGKVAKDVGFFDAYCLN